MTHLFLHVLELSITFSFVIGLIVLADRRFGEKYSVKWKCFLWLILAVRMIIPFTPHVVELNFFSWSPDFIQENLDMMSIDSASDQNEPVEQVQAIVSNEEKNSTDNIDSIQSSNTYIQKKYGLTGIQKIYLFLLLFAIDIFTYIWILGMGIYIVYHIAGYLSFLRKVKRWEYPVQEKKQRNLFSQIRNQYQIKKQIQFVLCREVDSPMLVGFMKPKLIMPIQHYQDEQLEMILSHELIHYKQRHLYFKMLIFLVNAMYWFNPFVYLMSGRANQDIEMACDEKVVHEKPLSYREMYSMTILETMKRAGNRKNPEFVTSFHGGRKQVKNRFYQIMNNKKKKRGYALVAFFMGLVLLAGNLTVHGTDKVISNDSQTAADTPILATALNRLSDEEPLKEVSRILLIGTDEQSGLINADAIVLVTLNPEQHTVKVNSIMRDLIVDERNGKPIKLSSTYALGGNQLVKESIEKAFGVTINATIRIKYNAFEKIIDAVGGVEVKLSKEEAEFLRTTNYITHQQNRNVKEGIQMLNGDQVLGYSRIRHVYDQNGNSINRMENMNQILKNLYENKKNLGFYTLSSILKTSLENVDTDLDFVTACSYLKLILNSDLKADYSCLPIKNTWKGIFVDGRYMVEMKSEPNQEFVK